MPRSTGGVTHARKRKRVLKRASGFVASPGTQYRSALEFTRRADRYAYRDRRQKKRHFRQLWITRLSAALKTARRELQSIHPSGDCRGYRIESQNAERNLDQRSNGF